jgi:cyclase
MQIMRSISMIAAVLALASLASAQDEDLSKVKMKVIKVSGSVYMLQGAGGNIGASVGEDGIVIVDDEFAPLSDKIRAALKDITDKPVRFVINTHWHFDHTGGNEPFSSTSTVITQDNVRKRLITGGTMGKNGSVKMEIKPASKAALPIITFDHDVSVHLNGEDIRALHFPSGHTDRDSGIFFSQSSVVHMGDDFVTYGFPFVDLNSGGSVEDMVTAMEKVSAQVPVDVKVIPGHGPISTLDDVRRYVTMLKETLAVVDKGIRAGKTLDQLKQENVLAPWQKWNGDFITTEQWLVTLYNDLTGKKTGEFLKHN